MKILVTGASGKTGNSIVAGLSQAGYQVIAFTHKEHYALQLKALGAMHVLIGDMRNETDMRSALHGCDGIYHICPNMTPDEHLLGSWIINLCEQEGVHRFVYHSVLHPQVETMPHHWQKLMVEKDLMQSKLSYTILQPTAYMQNLEAYRTAIMAGVYAMPYNTNARISLVSLKDVESAVVKVFQNSATVYGSYELVGTEPLSQVQVAQTLSRVLDVPVSAQEMDREKWLSNAIAKNMPEYSRRTLLSMFEYYDSYGLYGSPLSLTLLLGQKPITIEQYLQEEFIPNQD